MGIKMDYMLFTIIAIVVIIGVALLNKYYALGVVSGESMEPDFKNGQFMYIKKKYILKEGKVYLLRVENIVLIKRLVKIMANPSNGQLSLFFLGDNLDSSWDSRYFGWKEKDVVIGEVRKWRDNNERVCNT